MSEKHFFKCESCKNIFLAMGNQKTICCSIDMQVLEPNKTEIAAEKHIPMLNIKGSKLTVQVGRIAHPMTEEHYIEWIFVETTTGGLLRNLCLGDKPEAIFDIPNEADIVSVSAYCNLHGLWEGTLDDFYFSEEVCSPEF